MRKHSLDEHAIVSIRKKNFSSRAFVLCMFLLPTLGRHIKEMVSEIKKSCIDTITGVFWPNWTCLDSVEDKYILY